MMSESSWLPRILSAEALATLRILPRSADRLCFAVARLFRRAAGAVALDEEDLGAGGAGSRDAIGEAYGQPQFAGRGLARQLALLAPALALFGALGDAVEQYPRRPRVGAQPMVEMVLDGAFQRALSLRRRPAAPSFGPETAVRG
jgi:hypothetical protein